MKAPYGGSGKSGGKGSGKGLKEEQKGNYQQKI